MCVCTQTFCRILVYKNDNFPHNKLFPGFMSYHGTRDVVDRRLVEGQPSPSLQSLLSHS